MATCPICKDNKRMTAHGLTIHMGKIHGVHYEETETPSGMDGQSGGTEANRLEIIPARDSGEIDRQIAKLFEEGHSESVIAEKLGLGVSSIRKRLSSSKHLGLQREKVYRCKVCRKQMSKDERKNSILEYGVTVCSNECNLENEKRFEERRHSKKISALVRNSHKPVYLINCAECGKSAIVLYDRQKICADCHAMRYQIYYAIKNLRHAIATKAVVNPDEALAFVEDMIRQEGVEFKNLALDGIVERIIVDKRKEVEEECHRS